MGLIEQLKSIIPTADQSKLVQGIEGDLLRRRQTGNTIIKIAAIAWAIIQILLSVETKYLENIGIFFTNLFSGQWGLLIGDDSLPT